MYLNPPIRSNRIALISKGGMCMVDVYDTGGDWTFSVFPVLFFIVFIIILAVFVFAGVNGVKEWGKNNQSPRLTVHAVLKAKRADVSRHISHHNDHHTHHSSTTYYATFQFESGDRSEFRLTSQQYGMLAEGDEGKLTFQGTRFLEFERQQKEID